MQPHLHLFNGYIYFILLKYGILLWKTSTVLLNMINLL